MTNNYIKSPLNYTGGKYKLLNQIMQHFPEKIDTFIDLFTGGCNVGINVDANNVICNDIEKDVIEIYKLLKLNSFEDINKRIENIIQQFDLSRENKDGYIELRKSYNLDKGVIKFLTLIFHSFNNQIRFNKKGEFNLPFGGRTYNNNIKNNLNNFVDKLNKSNISFVNQDFREIIKSIDINKDTFIYCDPPYSLNFTEYNGRHFWNEKDDKDLLNMLDYINEKGGKFALSNVFESKGKSNDILKEWSKKYKVIYIETSYKNCNYIRNNSEKDVEVLIINY